MRILIADDHDLLRDTLALFFQAQSDIETYVASDLPSACKMIENDPPYDLVLLDLNMPGKWFGGAETRVIARGRATRSPAFWRGHPRNCGTSLGGWSGGVCS